MTNVYTETEIQFIKDNYMNYSNIELAYKLNRTKSSIIKKLRSLNLVRKDIINPNNYNYRMIKGYSKYSVTTTGIVFNNANNRIISVSNTKDGYLQLKIYDDNNKRHTLRLNRIVAKTFLKNNDKLKIEVNHINGIKTDNSISNLEWCTSKENKDHAKINKLIKSKYDEKVIHYISKLISLNKYSDRKIALKSINKFNLDVSVDIFRKTIWNIKNKKAWSQISDLYFL